MPRLYDSGPLRGQAEIRVKREDDHVELHMDAYIAGELADILQREGMRLDDKGWTEMSALLLAATSEEDC